MRGRLVLAGVLVFGLGASASWAAGPSIHGTFWLLKHACSHAARSTQCAVQIANGDDNFAYTEQYMKLWGHKHGTQVSLTYQEGDNNVAYTGQFGRNQASLTTQIGDDNHAFTLQAGSHQSSTSSEVGNGQWESTSSIGHNTQTSISFVATN